MKQLGMKAILCAFLAIMLCGCGLLTGNRPAASGAGAAAASPSTAPASAPVKTSSPTAAPSPSPSPTPSPAPELPPRYTKGEALGGVVLEVQSISDGTSAFLIQTFWMEAMFVNVANPAITDEAGGTYILAPGARVVMEFASDVPDAPPFQATASKVKIVDYLSDINGSDPYFVILRNYFGQETELYNEITRVAVDLSGAKSSSGAFSDLAREFCTNRGYELILAPEQELKDDGTMDENGFIEGGVFWAFSDSGEKNGVLSVAAERRIALQTRSLSYTLKKQAAKEEATWHITQVK